VLELVLVEEMLLVMVRPLELVALMMELVACLKEMETRKVKEDIQMEMETSKEMEDIQKETEDIEMEDMRVRVMVVLLMVTHYIPLEVIQKQNSTGWYWLDHQV